MAGAVARNRSGVAMLRNQQNPRVRSKTVRQSPERKRLPSLLMAAGSLLLAWRVKTLIDALMMAQRGAETNFRSITEFLAGQQPELPMIGFQQHVERSQRLGVWLLVLGFVMVVSSGLLNAYLLWAGF